ncbi:MAG: FAD-dependent oxidoreductase, partial [Candidatus Baltobacteraceae bacterium]
MREFDLIVVGSGAAGGTIARSARSRGWTVAIIDAHPFGGTCQLRGCDPKKVLVGAAHAFDISRKMAQIGILDGAPQLQWTELMRFKRTFTERVPERHAKSYLDAGIVAINGTARFTGEKSIEVNGEILSARHIAIASGAKAAPIAPGDELLIDNEGFLDLDPLPERLLFIGGGYISFEFAHVAARAGAHVQIIHSGPRPLPAFDEKLVEQLVAGSRDLGIEVHLNARVTKITRGGGGVT